MKQIILFILTLFSLLSFLPKQLISRDAPITTAVSKSSCPNSTVSIPLTVTNFTQITGISLRLDFDPTYMSYIGYDGVNAIFSGGLTINEVTVSANLHKILISWADITPVNLVTGSNLLNLTFTYISGSPTLSFNNSASGGGECEYADEIGDPMIDTPTTSFYFNSTISDGTLPVNVSIVASENPVCDGSTVTYTATPTNGGSTPAYQWKVNGSNVGTSNPVYVYTPGNSDVITCVLTSNALCTTGNPATSNPITMVVSPTVVASVSIAVSQNNVCSGTSVTFTPTPVGGGTPTYQWYKNSTAVSTGSTYSYVPVNGDVVFAVMTSSLACASGSPATSNSITMVVNSIVSSSVAIAVSQNNICSGTSVTFTPTPVGGGTPTYQWYKNSVAISTESTYSYVPVNGDVVFAVMTSSLACASGSPATSNSIIMVVNPVVAATVSIVASQNNVCTGTSVSFTPTPVSGGTPSYQWYKNSVPVSTGSTYSYVPVNGDVVYVVMTSSLACATGNPATSNSITMSVNPIVAASVSISESQNNICIGTSVTFTPTPVGGGSPSYQWYKNSMAVSTGSTYSYGPVNGDVVYVVMTSSLACASGSPATSSSITMTVNPVVVSSVSIDASQNSICSGTSVTFTPTPVGGGSPSYQWYKNSTAVSTGSTYSYVPVNGDVVFAVMTSSLACASGSPATSNSITMSVNPIISASVSISESQNNVCSGTMVTYTPTPIGGGTPTYQWYKNSIAVSSGSTYSYIPVNGDVIYVVMSSSLACTSGSPATSNSITMAVNPNLPVSVWIEASANPVCSGTSVIFTATPTNGGSAPAYQWKVNGSNVGDNSPVYTTIPVNNDVITCVMTSNAICATGSPAISNSLTMSVNPVVIASISIAASQNNICSGTSVTFTPTPIGGGTPAYQWYKNSVAVSAGSTYSYVPSNGDVVYVVMTSSLACATGSPATSNSITMSVNPTVAASVSIDASQNNVCTGTSVIFTPTPIGGGTPSYQWFKNLVAVSTGSTYSYVPVNGDVIYVVMTSSLACTTGNPATSNVITMVINPTVAASVSIDASQNNLCSGTSVTFTPTPVGGGTPAYQWYKNSAAVSTGSTYSYVPVNGDVVYVVMTSSLACATGSPATSNSITMSVIPLLPVSVSVGASANPVCAGTTVTFTTTPTNGGTLPNYQWKKGGTDIPGATNANYAYIPLNSDVITCVLTSNAPCATGSPATSNPVSMTVNPMLPVSVSVGASANPVCAGTTVTFTATPTNGGSTPSYQWKKGGTEISGAINATYAYIPLNGDVITCVLTSNATCATGSPATSSPMTMTVNPLLPVSVSVGSSANPVCAGTTVTFTATATNGGTSPAYQWKKGGTDIPGATNATYVYIPVNSDVISCVLTSNAICGTGSPATSNPMTITVNPLLPVSVLVEASANPVCIGTTVTFTATPTNGGTAPTYQWKKGGTDIPGATNTSYAYIPVNGDVITCVLTSNATCATGSPSTSSPVTMTVNPLLPASVSVGSSANPVCAGTTVTFTATPANGGTSPSYQWKVNGNNVGTDNSVYAYIPVNGDAITCVLTSNATCATGNPVTSSPITMVVNPLLPVSVSIGSSVNPVCAGITVSFTAMPTNGGTDPSYQWKVNGINAGTNNPVYAYIPLDGDVITCVLTSNATCANGNPATSSPITMTVNPLLPAGVSVGVSANPVCEGTTVTFTATPTNGGSSPTYQWYKNSVVVATGITYTYIPVNNDLVTCVLTSNATCATGSPATSSPVTLTVNPLLPVSVSVGSTANLVCAGTIVTFMATPANGGTAPSYQWKVNGNNVGTDNSIYSYIPVNNDVITCVLTSNAICATGSPATSNAIYMTVDPLLPVSVLVEASANPVCTGTTVIYIATPTNGGVSPSYQWKVNGNNVGTDNAVYSYNPVNGDAITCVLTSNATCATGSPVTSSPITMTVNPLLPVSVSLGASANSVCAGTTVTFTATPTNGGTNPSYQWKVNGINVGPNNSTYAYIPVNNEVISCVMSSNANCITGNPATSNPVTMIVNPLLPVSVSVGASANPVCAGTTVTYIAIPINGGSTPSHQWKVNGNNVGTDNSFYSYIPVNNDVITCALTSNATCATGSPATSIPVTMTVNPLLPVSVSVGASANPECAGTTVTFTATHNNGGTVPSFQWKVNGNNVGIDNSLYSYIPVNNDIITCILTSNATCATGSPATSSPVTMTVNPLLPVSVSVGASANPVCDGTTVTYVATPINGGTSPSYQWKVNGNNAGTDNSFYSYIPVNNDAITCVLTSNATCATGSPVTSSPVSMTVNPLLPVNVSVGASANPVCAGTTVTFAATPTNGGSTPTYQWKKGGTEIPGATNSTYAYIPVNGDVITCVLTSNATCATESPATSSPITMTVNPLMPVSVSVGASASPVCAGTMVTFIAMPTNGGTAPSYQWKVNGTNVGTDNSFYSYIPVNNDAITCVLTTNTTCTIGSPATSNAVIMTVNPLLPVSVSVGASANSVCAGSTVTFTATPTNGGTSPNYQWKVNGNNVGTDNPVCSYIPINGDVITCVLTSNATCATGSPATSNSVTMTVNPLLPLSVSVGASANPVCAGTTVTFTATPTNGGTAPSFQWKKGGTEILGATNATYFYIPLNSDEITCVLTSNATCAIGSPATSGAITMTVNPLPVPTITGPNSICVGSTGVTYLTESNMTNYAWSISSGGVITSGNGTNQITVTWNSVGAKIIGVAYSNQNGCTTSSPAQYNVIVNALPVPSIIGPTSVFSGNSGFIYTSEAGMTGYSWTISSGGIVDGGSGTNSITVSWNNPGPQTLSINYINSMGCTAVSPTVLNVMVNALPEPTITGSNSVCVNSENLIYFTETGQSNYTWTVSAGGSITFGGGLNDSWVIITWTTSGSQSLTVNYKNSYGFFAPVPTVLPVMVHPLLQTTIIGVDNPCLGASVEYLTEPGMTGYNWILSSGGIIINGAGTNEVSVIWNNSGPQTISVDYLDPFGCLSIPFVYNLTVYPAFIAGSISIDQTICFNTIPTIITGTEPTGGATPYSYQWEMSLDGQTYTEIIGATNLNYQPGTLSQNTYFKQKQFSGNNCGSGYTNSITITVNPLPTATLSGTTAICAGSSATLSVALSGSQPWEFVYSDGTTQVSVYNIMTSLYYISVNPAVSTTYSILSVTDANLCSNTGQGSANIEVNDLPIATATNNGPVCDGLTLNLTGGPDGMTTYLWTGSNGFTSDVQNPSITAVSIASTGNYSLLVTNSSGCSGSASTTVVINPLPGIAGNIAGPSTVTQNQTGVVFSTAPVSEATGYIWSLPSGATITSGDNSPVITVAFSGTSVSGIITVMGTNNCGNGMVSANFNLTVTPSIPEHFDVTGNITGTQCYNATNTIIVAGTGTTFTIQSGGHAEMIAGSAIFYRPGTTIQPGGYLWGHIAPGGPYCLTPALPAVIMAEDEISTILFQSSFKVYPNPTAGNFFLEITGDVDFVQVYIFGMWGEMVLTESLNGERNHEFSLSDRPVGVYFMRVVIGDKAETVKIIKL